MAEHETNGRILAALARWNPVRVENAVGPGTPDINYASGWIESKWVEDWPVRATTVLSVPHYTTGQRAWHMRRTMAGGRVHVAIEVAGEFFLFNARDAAQHLGVDWTRADMMEHAVLNLYPFKAAELAAFIEALGD